MGTNWGNSPPPLPTQPQTVEQSTVVTSTGKELAEWKDAIQKELGNMKGTLRPATSDEKAELDILNVRPTPSRMVFVHKPAKKKARLVVCGLFLDPFGDSNTSNLDAAPLRTLIASGWQKGKVLASMDITAAFLHAKMPKKQMGSHSPSDSAGESWYG